MALVTRISRLFKADFHAVLDQIEEPVTLLRQAIREMEDELSAAEYQLRLRTGERDLAVARRDELADVLAGIDEQLDICFESGKDELARDLIRRKLETERLTGLVEANLKTAEKDLQVRGRTIEENRAALQGMKQKAELFADRVPEAAGAAADIAAKGWNARSLEVRENEVEVAFLREKKRRAQS